VRKVSYVLENGVTHPVIRQSSLSNGRWQYYNGKDVDICLSRGDLKDLKGVNALTIDGVPVPIFRKDYLARYTLITEDNAEVLEQSTPISFNEHMKIVVTGTDRIVSTIKREHLKFPQDRPKNARIDSLASGLQKRKAGVLERKKNKIVAENASSLTTEAIWGSKDQRSNPLLYPDGTPIDPKEKVIKRNKRHRVVKPDGQEIPVIRKNTKAASRHVFYNGKDVEDTLEIHNRNAHKYHSSYVMIDDIRIPVFKKMALAKYILVDMQTGMHILPDTPIKLMRENEIFTQETDRPLTRLRAYGKNKIPGFENLFPMRHHKKPLKISSSDTSSMTAQLKKSSEISNVSVPPFLLENSFFSEVFDFEMGIMNEEVVVEEEVKSSECESYLLTSSSTPNFFNTRPSTPPIMDLSKFRLFTPGEEDPQHAAQVLSGII
jgi:hypothetical protein